MADIGRRIRAQREKMNLTQEELASKLGYKSKTTIAKIENGTNDIVQSKVVEFAKVLETTPAYLMGWNDKKQLALAKKISKARARKQISTQILAEKSNLKESSIKSYESGVSTPNITDLEKIATALGITINELIGWDESLSYEENLLNLPDDLVFDYDSAPVHLSAKQMGEIRWNLTFTSDEYSLAELEVIKTFAEFLKKSKEELNNDEPEVSENITSKVVTTEEEIESFYIIRGILAEIVSVEDIVHRDTESYFGILYKDNNRKPICRINLDKKNKQLFIPDENKKFQRFYIDSLNDIYKYKSQLIEAVKHYI